MQVHQEPPTAQSLPLTRKAHRKIRMQIHASNTGRSKKKMARNHWGSQKIAAIIVILVESIAGCAVRIVCLSPDRLPNVWLN